jgi:hypothetical protein
MQLEVMLSADPLDEKWLRVVGVMLLRSSPAAGDFARLALECAAALVDVGVRPSVCAFALFRGELAVARPGEAHVCSMASFAPALPGSSPFAAAFCAE